MKQKIDWMIGMVENMMNITTQHMDKHMVGDMYSLTSAMMGNFHQMKLMMDNMSHNMIGMVEQMMRSMEHIMMNLNMDDDHSKSMMKHMMQYVVMMQMSMITMNVARMNN